MAPHTAPLSCTGAVLTLLWVSLLQVSMGAPELCQKLKWNSALQNNRFLETSPFCHPKAEAEAISNKLSVTLRFAKDFPVDFGRVPCSQQQALGAGAWPCAFSHSFHRLYDPPQSHPGSKPFVVSCSCPWGPRGAARSLHLTATSHPSHPCTITELPRGTSPPGGNSAPSGKRFSANPTAAQAPHLV